MKAVSDAAGNGLGPISGILISAMIRSPAC